MKEAKEEAFGFFVEPLGQHDRAAFSCGNEDLDRYFKVQAGQDRRKNVAVPFVLVEKTTKTIAGFYSLSATTVILEQLPPELARRLPKYPYIPATLIGRFAIGTRYQGLWLGEFLLMDALRRALENSKQVASMAVIVDAKNEAARKFYAKYGFQPFSDEPYRLFLPMKTIAGLF